MKGTKELRAGIRAGECDKSFAHLYPDHQLQAVRRRYEKALDAFEALYGEREAVLVSAPGRTEICGNHTDHQRGRVLAAAVNLDVLCVAAPNGENVIRIKSEGYPADVVALDDLSPRAAERERASSLIRGVAEWLQDKGYAVGGFDAYTTSQVLGGSGLSSSAAFEVAVGNMLGALYAQGVTPVELAQAGQYAENVHFGKPSGLMDQMASSVGGVVQIDFADPEKPEIQPVRFDLAGAGLHLCIVDTRGSHADLTADYAAIPQEMGRVAAFFGKGYLREVDREDFYKALPAVREAVGDRGVLRAVHFFSDDSLVPGMARVLESGGTALFLEMIRRSGQSSFACLQNVFSPRDVQHQGLTLALALSGALLGEAGACRVHGGGFAGTIQAFVPDSLLERYRSEMDRVFGEGACHVLAIRPAGGVRVSPEMKSEVL